MRKFVSGAVGKALNKMSIKVVVKTVDQRYSDAKRQFTLLHGKIEKLLGQVLQLQDRLTVISASAVRLSETAQSICPRFDGPSSLDSFSESSRRFADYTAQTFSQEVESTVVAPLCQRQVEAGRVPGLQTAVRESRRAFDEQRAVVTMLRNQGGDIGAILKEEEKSRQLRERYLADREAFCGTVANLAATEGEAFRAAADAMAAVISRYVTRAAEEARTLQRPPPE
jgi:hypothetical protein